MVWAPYTTNNSQWVANKVLQGFLGAPIESLCEISISDVVCLPPLISELGRQLTRHSTLLTSVVHIWVSTRLFCLEATISHR
jgi:hypothetical protein